MRECKEDKGQVPEDGKPKIWELCQENDQFIESPVSLFENLLLPDICLNLTTTGWQNNKPDGDITAGKNSLGNKAIGYTCDAFNV